MCAGAIIMLLGIPIALGSWWGLLVIVAMLPALIERLFDEESFLSRNPQGYMEYQKTGAISLDTPSLVTLWGSRCVRTVTMPALLWQSQPALRPRPPNLVITTRAFFSEERAAQA